MSQPAVESQSHRYSCGGRDYEGFVARPSDGSQRCGAILLCHGGSGIGEHERGRAQRLAAAGYFVLAMDAFGETFSSREHGLSVITALATEPNALARRAADALTVLRSLSGETHRLGAIGFCFGGRAVLELARSGASFGCAVSFHGGLGTSVPRGGPPMRARVLACSGADDPFVSAADRKAFEEEMTARGASWRHFVFGGALHGFTEKGGPARPGCAYNEAADEASWSAMLELFRTSL